MVKIKRTQTVLYTTERFPVVYSQDILSLDLDTWLMIHANSNLIIKEPLEEDLKECTK